jgi:hypothetical protein
MTVALVFDDLTYISMADAVAGSKLSPEYLARLSRTGRLRARMVARMWFIEMHSLQQFLSARKESKPEQFAMTPDGSK